MEQKQPLYVLEVVDVRRADDGSRHLTITKIVLPEIVPILPKFELKRDEGDA